MPLLDRPSVDARRMKLRQYVPRWRGYLCRLYSIENELEHMVKAMGGNYNALHTIIDKIAIGDPHVRQYTDQVLAPIRKRNSL